LKNKKIILPLLVIVGFVWYKIFDRIKTNLTNDPIVQTVNQATQRTNTIKAKVSFKLLANYRDPFLGKQFTDSSKSSKNSIPKTSLSTPKYKEPINWPKIKYFGIVRKLKSKNPTALITVDDSFFHLKKGEIIYDGISVKGVTMDSLIIVYKKEKRVFYK
jgi:hypothetical protein